MQWGQQSTKKEHNHTIVKKIISDDGFTSLTFDFVTFKNLPKRLEELL